MSHSARHQRRRHRWCPRGDGLEPRLVLSTLVGDVADVAPASASPALAPVATEPAAGAYLSGTPSTLVVTFNRPIDPSSLGFNDLLVDRLDGDVVTPVL